MTNGNQGNGNGGGGDWSHPQSKPPHEPDDSQAPGPQGPRQPQGGEWSAGHTDNQPNQQQQQQQPRQESWQQGPGHPQGGQYDQPPVHQPGSNKPKLENNDIIAIVLSVFFPGVGQMMLGQTTKGIVILAVSIFTCAAGGLLSIGAALDAYCVAMARKKRPIDDWEIFPDLNELF
ncbi:MAG: hypothetical protein ACLFVJ_15270 [Persicimonas sp.]